MLPVALTSTVNVILISALVFYYLVTYYCKLSVLKQYKLFIPQFLWIRRSGHNSVGLSCSGFHKVVVKVSARAAVTSEAWGHLSSSFGFLWPELISL